MTISIIIRTKNEERWIRPLFDGIARQDVDEAVEIILVDNNSNDRTVKRAIAYHPNLKVVNIDVFLPGKAINDGIRASCGEFIVIVSAHCPPVRDDWLSKMKQSLIEDKNFAGVYGRQVPVPFTSPTDKRDLLITFGLDRKVQIKDSFFHNANSMILREIWERYPFDESVKNIEDRIWGQQVIEAGYKILYEPEAEVFHYHGIHQSNKNDRVNNIISILESNIPEFKSAKDQTPLNPNNLEVCALIPIKKEDQTAGSSFELIERTIRCAQDCPLITQIHVTTDSESIAEFCIDLGVTTAALRNPKDSPDYTPQNTRADQVLASLLKDLEASGYLPDVVVPLETLYPFRTPKLLTDVIERLLIGGFDTVMAGYEEYRPVWSDQDGVMRKIDNHRIQRDLRSPFLIGLPSLACATFPSVLRAGNRVGQEVALSKVNDPLASIEVRTIEQLALLKDVLSSWGAG